MKSASILSAADKDQYLSECEPGESITITATLGEPDAAGNYPLTVDAISPMEGEATAEEDTEPMPMSKPKPKKPGVAAVLEEE